MKSRRRKHSKLYVSLFALCWLLSVVRADVANSELLAVEDASDETITVGAAIPGREASTVQEYLSYVPIPTSEEDSTATSSSPSVDPPTSEESQELLQKNDLTLVNPVMPVDDADLPLPTLNLEVLTAPINHQDSPIVHDSPVPVVEEAGLVSPDNVPSVTNNATRTNESGSTEVHDEIPSFSEWTQKVLAQEEKSSANGNGSSATPTKVSASAKLRQKNYASPDCGAKILAANPEAEHTGAILDPARDEYFLSICSAKIWFVIELCEAIQAQRVEIANFELFSSSPKDFRVFISDRYPTRDWALLGQFAAVDERSIQSFPLERQLFGKFIKVELVSHFGKEHFCPISLFRVFGNSEYEVLDIEEGSRSEVTSTPEEDSTDEEMLVDATTNNRSDEGALDVVGSAAGRNLFGSAKDAVINIVKKAAEALGSPSGQELTKMVNQTLQELHPSVCHTAVSPANVSRAVNGSLSCQWNELTFLASLPWLHPYLTHQCRAESPGSLISYQSPEVAFARAIWSPSTIQALCHWVSPEELLPPLPIVVLEPISLPTTGLATEVENLTPSETLPAELETVVTELPIQPVVELVDLDNLEQLFTEELEATGSSAEDMTKLELVVEPTKTTGSTPQQQQQHQQQTQQQQQQKESVFVRLSNRIKVLERNMSLSGQYLEELSRRYKRQVDDMQKALNRTLQTLNETLQRMDAQEDKYQSTLSQLIGDISELRASTQKLSDENLSLRNQVIEQHLFLMILEVLVVIFVVVLLLRRANRPPVIPPISQTTRSHRRAASTAGTVDYRLEVGQQVQEVVHSHPVSTSSASLLTLDVSQAPRRKGQHQSKASPAPSLADSTSSGCESAFSFPNSNHAASRDHSPINEIGKTSRSGKAKSNGSKKQKKKKNLAQQQSQHAASMVYHVKDSKSSPPPPPKIRLKSDNWEWGRSRAKVLAVEFIKQNFEANTM